MYFKVPSSVAAKYICSFIPWEAAEQVFVLNRVVFTDSAVSVCVCVCVCVCPLLGDSVRDFWYL